LIEANYKNNQFDGVVQEFLPNGHLKSECTYVEGKKNGACRQ